MNNKGFNVIAGIIILAVLVLIGGVGVRYLVAQKQIEKKVPADESWLVYSSPNQDFSFQYPRGWELKFPEVDKSSTSQFYTGETLVELIEFINGDRASVSFGVTTYPANGMSLKDFIFSLHGLAKDPAVFPPRLHDVIVIKGLPMSVSRYQYDTIEGGLYLSSYILKNNTVYRLNQHTRVHTIHPEKQEEYDDILRKIIKTFSFNSL